MRFLLAVLLLIIISPALHAGRISGLITNEKGEPLAYASILIKGTTIGTTANNRGIYFIDLPSGRYTIVCQYVGYQRQEKTVNLQAEPFTLNFRMALQNLSLAAVEVRPGGEDPAYEIIRQAIRKRRDYENPLDSFSCEAYIKTLVRTRKLPRKVMGKKIDDEDWNELGVDSGGKGIIYLSESITKVAFRKPNKTKLEVISGRESGSNGYGFNFPVFINFYSNNVSVFSGPLQPRGFVSPIADAALNYYRYKYLGSFTEDGREINKIRVIPRRKYEPLFSGTIDITEGDWRIHSLELSLNKESQLQLLDTLRIKQIQVPVAPGVWQTKDQWVYFTFNLFGVDAVGNLLNVYNKYDLHPGFRKKYFNSIVVQYDTAVNRKTRAYWDSIRPVPLEPEEIRDYTVKDSAFHYRRDSVWGRRDRDSLRKARNRISAVKLLWSGYQTFNRGPENRNRTTIRWEPLIKQVQYNTVEGINLEPQLSLTRVIPSWKKRIGLTSHWRYGFSNGHLNPWGSITLNPASGPSRGPGTSASGWTLSGGSRVSQFNADNPISPLMNSLYTLFFRRNYMKIYEDRFLGLSFHKGFTAGPQLTAGFRYEDRLPLYNREDFSLYKKENRAFTPNYPFEQLDSQFTRHQAVLFDLEISYRPGMKYIQYPRFRRPIGSPYPTFSFSYQKGIPDLWGSDVSFDKWKFSVWDDINLKLRGQIKYRFSIGGFIQARSVYIQDYQHFNGNQLIFASAYTNSFQMAPYYANSTTASLFGVAHIEHHLNGFLTNKIPAFRRLNWNLVLAGNAFYVNSTNNYAEFSVGLENILKILRVDMVVSYLDGRQASAGIRLGLGGLLGGSIGNRF